MEWLARKPISEKPLSDMHSRARQMDLSDFRKITMRGVMSAGRADFFSNPQI
jgi:hypothetical protein